MAMVGSADRIPDSTICGARPCCGGTAAEAIRSRDSGIDIAGGLTAGQKRSKSLSKQIDRNVLPGRIATCHVKSCHVTSGLRFSSHFSTP